MKEPANQAPWSNRLLVGVDQNNQFFPFFQIENENDGVLFGWNGINCRTHEKKQFIST